MLFKVHHNKSFKELNKEVLAIPQLANLTDQQLVFVALVSDYESPLRTLPDKQRRTKAAELAGYALEKDGKRLSKFARSVVDGQNKGVEEGILAYKDIQYDEKAEALLVLDKQIQDAIDSGKEDKVAMCTIITERIGKDGKKTVEKKIDAKTLYAIRLQGNKLAAQLPELRAAKEQLKNDLRKDADVNLPTLMMPDDLTEGSDENQSTLDKFIEQRNAAQ